MLKFANMTSRNPERFKINRLNLFEGNCVIFIKLLCMDEKARDIELVKKFINGDERAFNEIVKLFQQQIYWYSRKMVGNHTDADEITQEVIITLYNKLHTFRFDSKLSTWIYKIVTNRSLNYLRKQKIKSFIGIDNEEMLSQNSSDDIVRNIEIREQMDKLNRVLSKLPIKQKEVFVLRHFENLTYEEIAEITGKSVGALKANYFHAINKVTEKINGLNK